MELEAPAEQHQNMPLSYNPRFTGREDILKTLNEMFFAQKPSSQRVALVGLGGIGKTQVALQFANQVKKQQPDIMILWVAVLSDSTVEQAYVDIAHRLNLRKNGNKQSFKELVCQYLSSDAAGTWFMVVDNADDHDLVFGSQERPGVDDFLPFSQNGSILLTTRSRQVAEEFAQSEVVELDQMSNEEAMCFFEKSMIRKDVTRDTRLVAQLLENLMYLPLAIAQAAAYINQTKMPIRNYLALLHGANASRVFSREFKDNTRYKSSHNAIATTWLISFEQIQKLDQTAMDLMEFLSCIEPKAIPQSLLPVPDPEGLEWAVGILCGYSFLVRRNESDIFDVHSLVHLAMERQTEKQGKRNHTLHVVVKHLTAAFSQQSINRDDARLHLPHAFRVMRQCSRPTEELTNLQMVVGKCLYEDRRFSEATDCLERAVAWRRTHLPEESEIRLDAEHELSRAYLDNRQHKETIELLEHILHVRRRISPQEDHFRLFTEILLGRAYLETYRIREAVELLEHVAAVRRAIHPAHNHYRLVAEHVLASTYVSDLQVEKAIPIFEHIVDIDRKMLSRSDLHRLTSEQELARAYLHNHRVKEAIELLEHVVSMEKTILRETDHYRLSALSQLARAYLEDERVDEAIDLLEYVTSIRRTTLADQDSNRIASEYELGRAYFSKGRIRQATEILTQVVAIWRTTMAAENLIRLKAEEMLAKAYLSSRRTEEAIELLKHVVSIKGRLAQHDIPGRLASIELLRTALQQKAGRTESRVADGSDSEQIAPGGN